MLPIAEVTLTRPGGRHNPHDPLWSLSSSRVPATVANLVVLLATAAIVGCSDGSVMPHPDPGPSIPPKLGSTFTYREFSIDGSGRELDGTSRTVTATVVSSDTTSGGVSGLTLFREDTAQYFVRYASSGDVMVRSVDDELVGDGLQTWPFGSRASVIDVIADTLVPSGDSIKTFVNSSYVEAAFTTTPAGTFSSHKIRSFVIARSFPDTSLVDNTIYTDRWYAPELGVVVKSTVDNAGPNRRIRELVSYSLR